MVKPKQLGHVVLRVRDAERSKAFCCGLGTWTVQGILQTCSVST